MRIIFSIILLFVASFGLLWLSKFGGEGALVIFQLAGYKIELSFLAFIFITLISLVVLYYALRFIIGVFSAPKKVGEWNKSRNQKLSQTKFGDGFLALMKGDWKKAEKQLMSKAQFSEVPFVNYLAAAQAAHEQGKYGNRDTYLDKALDLAPKDKLAIKMTKARLHQKAGHADEALEALLSVKQEGAKNKHYIAMLVQAYDELNNSEKVSELLPLANKMKALPASMLADIQSDLDLEKFNEASDKERAWKELAKTSQKDPDFIAAYADYQMQQNRSDLAEKLIRTALKDDWNETLVNVYGSIQSTNRKKMLRQIDGWLLARPESAELHLAAGKLAMQDKDTERAQQEFEQAIKLASLPEAFEQLGLLYESEQDLRKALTLYRTGIAAVNGNYTPALEEDKSKDEGDDSAEAKEGELLPKD